MESYSMHSFVWLLKLNIMFVRIRCAVALTLISMYSLCENTIYLYILLTCHLGSFQFETITNSSIICNVFE